MSNRILIDTNALIVYLLGLMDPDIIKTHKRTQIYEPEDFFFLANIIQDPSNILVTPNTITETDNLLNNFSGERKYTYILAIAEMIRTASEHYIQSNRVIEAPHFISHGITDIALILLAQQQEVALFITADSKLGDLAKAHSINVLDLVEYRNSRV